MNTNTAKNTSLMIEMSFTKAACGFFIPLSTVIALVLNGAPIVVALLSAIVVSCFFSLYLGYKWDDIQESALKGVARVFSATFMMILVGMMIAVWIESGSVPTLLYYGINFINPTYFLPLTFLVCLITSMTIGTSWGTAGTVGLALIGVSGGLGIPLPITAGAIISGALVGEKLSPISSTTILTAANTGVNLIDHIISMLNTTIPATLISLLLFTYLGFTHMGHAATSVESIVILADGLKSNFNISPILLIPPVFVLVLSAMRKPAIPVFIGGIVLGGVCALIFQKTSFTSVLNASISGYKISSGISSIDELLNRGGAISMASTVYLCICAGMFSGILDKQGILSTLMNKLLTYAKSTGGLILSTTIACLVLMLGGAGQYCTLTLPGVAFRKSYEERDVHPCVLGRTMEDSGTMVGSIIPWDVSAFYYSSILGVSMLDYAPYTFIGYMTPFISVLCAYLGVGVFRINQEIRPLTLRAAI
ncbi:Na+/H+ antiporter NhaC [Photorhabdus aegyptia]|uniref:Transporter, NhaC family n=1 Tax=Photorhabdus aegyptia TaxID=2805098 RepID=A0A022PEF3_9GAMM|nr:Na+/H+ antiporter NhaC [Photorhabdus aegyptia]EYU13899.1 transporter, NhaC family [Photorhabdus aegyptia]